MNKVLLILTLVFSIVSLNGQVTNPENDRPYIEVTGMSETEVVPDEIYITIILMERPENREKLSIVKQEESLKQAVKELGIDQSNLSLVDANADFRKIKMLKKDVVITKVYLLKITNGDVLAKLYDKLDKMNAQDAYISKVSHSKMVQLTKDNRVKALKAAKEKVDYLLAAVGQTAGRALYITETSPDSFYPQPLYANRMAFKNASGSEEDAVGSDIEFKKIKITSTFLVRYEINPTK